MVCILSKDKTGEMTIIQSYSKTILTGLLFSFVLALCLLLPACSDKVVDQDKFIKVYADIRIAEDTLTGDHDNAMKVKNAVLKRYGLTEEEYRTTFEYYNDNPEMWETFYDKVIARVDTLKKRQRK
jgi:hypothetical protein